MKASWFLVAALLLPTSCAEPQPQPTTVDPQPPPPGPAPAPAPAPEPGPEPAPGATQCSGPPPGAGYECVQDCGPPVSKGNEPPPGWSWLSAEDAAKRKQFGCPICLPHDALIATPKGDIPISQLKAGELVWSMVNGRRVARRIERIASVRAPAQHHLTVIDLEDGRRLRASPGHPDADGHALGDAQVGTPLDGSRIRTMTRAPYSGHTFDLLLEAGATHYFANGVLLRSSLR